MAVALCAIVLTVLTAAAPTACSAGDETPPALRVGGWEDVQKRVAAHRGKVVLVDVWTTTCGACRMELPKILALQEKFDADRFACVTVACDYDGIAEKPPEFYRRRVEDFLSTSKPGRAEHVLLDVAFIDFLERQKLRSTPAVYLYGADGKLVRRFDNDDAKKEQDEYTFEQVEKAVTDLLAK